MSRPLKILHLEDFAADAELVSRELKRSGINGEIVIVNNKVDFIRVLKEFSPDIILSDHSLPTLDSYEALQIVKQIDISIPFILITATVSEEYAVKIIKEGAADYILKDRLQRLPSAIWNALEKMETEAQLANQIKTQQKLITETSIQAQEQEREAISRELHDNINQILATAKLYLEYAIKKDGLQSELLQKSQETIMLAIDQIRHLTHSLIAPSLGDITLISALNELIEDIHLVNSVQLKLSVENFEENHTDKKIKLMFYRVVQEQINNILKHSKAKNAIITLNTTTDKHELRVKDDGVGFDTTKKFEGIGFKNILNRVGFYDGKLLIISAPGKGCTLEISIPTNYKIS